MKLEEYQRLKKIADEAQRQNDRVAGAIEQLRKQLRKEGCGSLEDAVVERDRIAVELKKLERTFDKESTAFEKEFGDRT